MITMKVEISKEDYINYKDKDYKELSEFIELVASTTVFPPNAYGCYPLGVLEEDGKYFATWERYESCG